MADYEGIFSKNLRDLRKAAGLTQKELGETIGYSEKTVSKWECGAGVPDIHGLFALCGKLGVTMEELFSDANALYFLGIDGGGTKTALVLADSNREVIRTLRTDNCNPFDIGVENAQKILRKAIDEICGSIPKSSIVAFAGMAGGASGNMKQVFREFFQSFRFKLVENDSDNLNLMEAGLGDRDGMVLILGTGICGWARLEGRYSRAAGWGYLIDQGGSAYNLGQEALQAYYNAVDGMAPWSPLSEAVKERCPEGHQNLLSRIYEGGKKYIASFAPLVFEALEASDPLAEAILQRNMSAAARVIETVGKRFPQSADPIPVVLAGGLTAQPRILSALQEALQEPWRYCLKILDQEPVFGALGQAYKLWEQK